MQKTLIHHKNNEYIIKILKKSSTFLSLFIDSHAAKMYYEFTERSKLYNSLSSRLPQKYEEHRD